MAQKFKLYKKTVNTAENPPLQTFSKDGYTVTIYKPKFFKFGLDKSDMLRKVMWYFITLGRYRVLYVLDDQKVIHYSFIIPKNFRFPFMRSYELEIGPCFTDTQYRGRGIYTKVLQMIPKTFKESAQTFWIYTPEENIASQKAIERAGYKYCGLACNFGLLKILKQDKAKC